MRLFKLLFFKYQKAMWYVAQTGNELGKPLRFYSEFALLILLADRFGFKLNIVNSVLIYITIIAVAVVIGKILANTGVVKYNTELSNQHNNEITEILKLLKEKKK